MHFSKLKKNILLFYVTRTFFIPFFWLPILYIYLVQNKGLSDIEAGFLLSLQELSLIFLEVPTGVIADKISRRVSVALGYIFTSLPFVLLPFVGNYYLIIILFLGKAIGKALISGADTSLLYDTLLDAGKESEYKKIINNSKALFTGCVAICIFVGGLIARYNIDLTLILPFPLMLIGAVAVMFMDEPESSKKGKALQHSNYLIHTWDAFRYLLKSRFLIAPIIIFIIADSLAVNMKWFYGPMLMDVNLNIEAIGGITALLYVLKSVLGFVGGKAMHQNAKVNIIWSNIIVAAGFIAMAIFYNLPVIVIGLFLAILGSEILDSAVDEEIHNGLESKTRAAAASLINLLGSVGATLMLYGFTFSRQLLNPQASVLFLGLVFVVSLGVSLLIGKGHGAGNIENVSSI